MSATNLGKVNKIIDPTNPNNYWEIEDKYAREQVVLKLQKTMVNSLPAKPTTYEDWIAMQPFLYYLPIAGQDNEYEVWTLFFMGDPTVPADYTDTSNYEWAKCGKTDVDLSNFSTKGHTHEVVTDVAVEDHDYTPQGQVVSEFKGASGETTEENTHKHTYTPQGSVNSSFSGTQGETQSGTTGITPSKTKKALKKKTIKLESAGVSITPTTANRATGDLEALNAYDASKAVFNGISVSDGALSFGIKKMSTAQTMTGASGSTDATKVTLGGNTTTEESLATGDLEDNAQATNQVMTDVTLNDPGHKHNYTPAGTVSSSFTGTQGETSEVTHSHNFQAHGAVISGFRGLRANLKHRVDNRRIITSPDQEDQGSHIFDWYGIRFDEAETNPAKTRVGNMDMHRMLPIQTKMRRCLLNDDGTVNYYLDDNDSTKRAGSQEGYVTSEETFMSKVETDEIRDETEEIGVIKGDSVSFNQSARWSGTNRVINGIAITYNSTTHILHVEGTATNNGNGPVFTWTDNTYPNGHKVYNRLTRIGGTINLTSGSSASFGTQYNSFTPMDNYLSNRVCACIEDITSGYSIIQILQLTAGDYFNADYYLYQIDITQMGLGDFTTIAQVEEWLSSHVGLKSYYPYNAGTLLSNTMQGIQTIGFNKWDEEWESGAYNTNTGEPSSDASSIRSKNYIPVKENTLYAHNAKYELTILFYDSEKNIVQYVRVNEAYASVFNKGCDSYQDHPLFQTPAGCAYIRFTVINQASYNNDICINISDPKRNGEYEPYNAHTYNRDVTQITGINPNTGVRELVAPNGLQKADMAGTVIDSIYNDANGDAVCKKMCGMRAYASGDESDSTVITDLTNTIYGLTIPILYTDLQWGDGSPVILPIEIEAEKNATINILPQNESKIVTAAPTLQMKKYVLTQGANLDGSDGQVMVEIPEHWRRVRTYLDGAKTMVDAAVSPYPQETTGWVHIKKGYISAYEASIIAGKLCSVSNIVNLTLAIQNGKIVATCDVSSASGQSDITSLLPTTNVTMDAMRTAARARALDDGAEWNQLVYEQYLAVVWLYWIEYANLNSQATFTNAKTVEGFMQGGLGNGVSTISSGNWDSFNGSRPFIPCGITNCLGNHSGEVYLTLPSGLGGGTVAVPSYRGIENFSGHIWKFADGIKYLGDGSKQSVLRCDNPANYSSASASTGYTSIGDNYGDNGWKTKIMIGDDGDINCKAVGGSSNLAYCDYNYQAHANGTYYCCLLGGEADHGSFAGVACVLSSRSVALSGTYVGSRLCYFEADI
jgi:hypothetical protein